MGGIWVGSESMPTTVGTASGGWEDADRLDINIDDPARN